MDTTARVQELLGQLRAGQNSARDALLEHSLNRVKFISQKMFRRQADLRALAETDDVTIEAMIRLRQALTKVSPETPEAFFQLAGRHIRFVLQDLIRQKHRARLTYKDKPEDVAAPTKGPADLAQWAEYHDAVEALPEADRQLFDLIFYQGLQNPEAAAMLKMSLRTFNRRWQEARLRLVDAMKSCLPEGAF